MYEIRPTGVQSTVNLSDQLLKQLHASVARYGLDTAEMEELTRLVSTVTENRTVSSVQHLMMLMIGSQLFETITNDDRGRNAIITAVLESATNVVTVGLSDLPGRPTRLQVTLGRRGQA